MSLEAQGAYLRILCHMWLDSPDQCSIPIPSDESLARILSVSKSKVKKLLKEFSTDGMSIFQIREGRWVSKRLQLEKANGDKIHANKRKAGLAGSAARHRPPEAPLEQRGGSAATAAEHLDVQYTENKEREGEKTLYTSDDASPYFPSTVDILETHAAIASPNTHETFIRYARSWIARSGGGDAGWSAVQAILSQPAVQGHTVISIEDAWFGSLPRPSETDQAKTLIASALNRKGTK